MPGHLDSTAAAPFWRRCWRRRCHGGPGARGAPAATAVTRLAAGTCARPVRGGAAHKGRVSYGCLRKAPARRVPCRGPRGSRPPPPGLPCVCRPPVLQRPVAGLALEGGVPVVLHRVVGAPLQHARNGGPAVGVAIRGLGLRMRGSGVAVVVHMAFAPCAGPGSAASSQVVPHLDNHCLLIFREGCLVDCRIQLVVPPGQRGWGVSGGLFAARHNAARPVAGGRAGCSMQGAADTKPPITGGGGPERART